jgi:hypothetical protein
MMAKLTSNNTDRQEQYPGPYHIDSKWVLGAVTAAAIAYPLVRSLIQQPNSFSFLCKYIVTLFTGIWYWVRYHYTEGVTSKVKQFPSLLSTIVIGLVGLSCFPLCDYWFWFIALASVLGLAVVKDIEIMLYQWSKTSTARRGIRTRWKASILICHECYAVVRDVSMAMWWIIYGILSLHHGLPSNKGILLFGVPYVIFVIAWSTIKVAMHNIESLG